MNLDGISIGVDLEEVSRFRGKSTVFLSKIFTPEEQHYCNEKPIPEQHYAARFCAKEAFIKALSGLSGFSQSIVLTGIGVYNDEQGLPKISYEREQGIVSKLSLSHDRTKAMAVVIVSRDV